MNLIRADRQPEKVDEKVDGASGRHALLGNITERQGDSVFMQISHHKICTAQWNSIVVKNAHACRRSDNGKFLSETVHQRLPCF